MKKLIVLSLSAVLLAGTSFATDHKHEGKKCAQAKECKKEEKDCCSSKETKKTASTKDTKKTVKKAVKA